MTPNPNNPQYCQRCHWHCSYHCQGECPPAGTTSATMQRAIAKNRRRARLRALLHRMRLAYYQHEDRGRAAQSTRIKARILDTLARHR